MAETSKESEPLLASRSRSPDIDTCIQLASRRRTVWTLPLVVVTYFLAYYTSVVVFKPYIYDQVADEFNFKGHSSSEKPCAHADKNSTNSSSKEIEDKIQRQVSNLELYLTAPCYPFAALSILIVGPLTDRYGRRVGFLFPIVGTLLKHAIYLTTVRLRLPVMVLAAGHICDAVGGSFASMLTAMFSVISDVTVPGPQRSYFITMMEALQTMTGAASVFAIGQWIKSSYTEPLIFSLVMSTVSLVMALCLLPETLHVHSLDAPSRAIYRGVCSRVCNILGTILNKFKRSFSIFLTDTRRNHVLAKRRLCLVVFVLVVAVNFSTPGVQSLYLMKSPLCWPMTRIFTYTSIQIVCNWVAIFFIMALLQRVFKMADRHIAIIGVISSLLSAGFMSLAVNDVMVYEVAVIAVMVRAIIPMLRSVMSSIVDKTDQGAVYASMGCVELVGAALFGTAANRLYYATVSTWDGAVFVMFAGLMAIALLVLIILNLLFLKDGQKTSELARSTRHGSIQEDPDPSW